ncbi:hypothetical protein [Buchananella hordeovulneris]|uniref:hypothetical protein n=1 Tax=Buchananella hordeovulneris TaxID=52770 RepID=UPI000F5F1ED0|nr:hypothetical protein [Buchananella hordeovulneris]MDO5081139.1 hypothetical protein [Buchananella hordeovulneris]RRD53320.1 hypothetical protein EII12_02335 [Buchananella hordeovulneris]
MSELVVELYGQRRWTDTHKASTTQLLGRLIYEPCEDAFPLHRCMEWWQIAPGAQLNSGPAAASELGVLAGGIS